MTDFASTLGALLGLLLLIFVTLLMLGANFAPNWAKSRGFLVAACALIVIGSNTFH
ncbi:MAG: hypothetical protein WBN04_14665 [Paracoccaceae bacterium]